MALGDGMPRFARQARWICSHVELGNPITVDMYAASGYFPKLTTYAEPYNYGAWVKYVERPATDQSCTNLMTYAARHRIGMTNVGQTLCKRMPPTESQLRGVLVTWLDSMRHLHYHGAVLPATICIPSKGKAQGQRVEPPAINVNFNLGGSLGAAWKAANKMLSGHENNNKPLSSRSISSADAFASAISAEFNSKEAALRGSFARAGPASQALHAEPMQPDAPPRHPGTWLPRLPKDACWLPRTAIESDGHGKETDSSST